MTTLEALAAEVAALRQELAKRDARIDALAAALKDQHAALTRVCSAPAIRLALGAIKLAGVTLSAPDASGVIVAGPVNPEAARVKAAAGLANVYEARHDAVGAIEAGKR